MNDGRLTIATLDIGSYGVRMVVCKVAANGSQQRIAWAEAYCDGGLNALDPKDIYCGGIKTAIHQIKETIRMKKGLEIKSCYVNIPNEMVSLVSGSAEIDVKSEDGTPGGMGVGTLFNKVLSNEFEYGKTPIDLIPLAYKADGKRFMQNPESTFCQKLEVEANVCLAKDSFVEPLKRILASEDLEINGFIPSFFSHRRIFSSSLFHHSQDDPRVTAIVDVGAAQTEISVYYNGIPFCFTTLPNGGKYINDGIAEEFGISDNEAESLKLEFNVLLPEPEKAGCDVFMGGLDSDQVNQIELKQLSDVMLKRTREIVYGCTYTVENMLSECGSPITKPTKYVFIGDGIAVFSDINKMLSTAVTDSEVEAINKGKDFGTKNSYVNACSMVVYISSKLKYGRSVSTVIDHNVVEPEAENETEDQESIIDSVKNWFVNAWEKIKNFTLKSIDNIKEFFKDLKE